MTDNVSRSELALAMVTTLPRWGSWAAYLSEVDTPYGRIGYRQTSIMWILRKGTVDGKLNHNTTSVIAAEIGVQDSVITRASDHLVHLGLIERITSTEDRRRQLLSLTPKGVQASKYIENLYTTAIQEAMSDLDHETLIELQNSVNVLHGLIKKLAAKPIGS